MRRLPLLAFVLPITVLAADGDYRIAVSGSVGLQGASAAAVPVQLYVGPTDGKCSGQPHAFTDSKGNFSFVRMIERSWRENFAVFVRTFALCAREGEQWVELWSFRTGPPPERIAFECVRSISKQTSCRVEWDGRVLQNVQPNSRLVDDASESALRASFSASQPGR